LGEERRVMLPTVGGIGGGARVRHLVGGEVDDSVGEAVESGDAVVVQ
jgi:hypothetical protein